MLRCWSHLQLHSSQYWALVILYFLFCSLQKLNEDDNSVHIKFQNNSVVLTFEPFRLDFLVRDEVAVSVNSRGLMNFEHYRLKKWVDRYYCCAESETSEAAVHFSYTQEKLKGSVQASPMWLFCSDFPPPPPPPTNSVKGTCTVFWFSSIEILHCLETDREREGGGGWIWRNFAHIFLHSWKKNTGTFFSTKRVDMPNFSRFWATSKIATK